LNIERNFTTGFYGQISTAGNGKICFLPPQPTSRPAHGHGY